jgi:hypothetical protein
MHLGTFDSRFGAAAEQHNKTSHSGRDRVNAETQSSTHSTDSGSRAATSTMGFQPPGGESASPALHGGLSTSIGLLEECRQCEEGVRLLTCCTRDSCQSTLQATLHMHLWRGVRGVVSSFHHGGCLACYDLSFPRWTGDRVIFIRRGNGRETKVTNETGG